MDTGGEVENVSPMSGETPTQAHSSVEAGKPCQGDLDHTLSSTRSISSFNSHAGNFCITNSQRLCYQNYIKSIKCGGQSCYRTSIMPPDRNWHQDVFDINLLDSRALDTPDGLTTALRAIETVCYRGDPEIAEMVTALDSRPHLLEYIISGTQHVTVGHRVSPPLITSPSSARGRGLQAVLEVDIHRVPYIHHAKHDGYHEYATPPQIFVFVAVRRVYIHS